MKIFISNDKKGRERNGKCPQHQGNRQDPHGRSGGIVAFVVVALTWVPDWISPEGTNGSGNQPDAPGVGRTSRMIQ